MEPNQQTQPEVTQPQTAEPVVQTVSPQPASSPIPAQSPSTGGEKKSGGFLLAFLILLLLAVVVLGGIYYFLFLNNPLPGMTGIPTADTIPSQVPTVAASPTPATEAEQVQGIDTGTVDTEVVDLETDVKAL